MALRFHVAIVGLGLLVSLTGCATALQITYYSDPPGAMLYENQRLWGYTPLTLQYQPSEEFKRAGCMSLQPMTVRWASGAEASIQSLQACASNGYGQQFVFVRPSGVPGRELDVQFALELQRIVIMQQQAEAQRMMQVLQLYNSINQQNQLLLQQRTVNCTSHVYGNTIRTNCY